jgi:hypothetical protein
VRQLRFAAVCFVIHAVGLILGNFAYIRKIGDTSQWLYRVPITVIIVLGLWAGIGLARWIGLFVAAYLASVGWLTLISALPIRFYAHPPYPKWVAISLVVIAPLAATLAFLALTHIAREST